MATDNNIKNFTAADIEKYHKGQLSAKEMHELEKAAMDDPFLADALEGYAVAGVNVAADLTDLKNRLSDKIEGAKIIPIQTSARKNYSLLKAVAMIIFIAGAAFLIYQFGFNNKTAELAQNEPVAKVDQINNDSVGQITSNIPSTPAEIKSDEITTNDLNNSDNKKPGTATITNGNNSQKENKISTNNENIIVSPTAVTNTSPDNKSDDLVSKKDPEKKEIAKAEVDTKAAGMVKQENNISVTKDKSAEKTNIEESKNNRAVAIKKAEDQNYRNLASNTFRGRVVDQNNTGVPFANVTNLEENTGTYTDARGYFNLTYPDSVLNVQIRSIGFENNNVQLRNNVSTNEVVMQDDRKSLSEVVVSNKKPNLEARVNNTMKLEEPEPADGWSNYDNYLVNNLQVPEDFKSKPVHTGEVQVSFEVNKNGEPVNFKIEKSLCSKCDKEAIRLVKDGPKWIRNAKNGRTTVTITF